MDVIIRKAEVKDLPAINDIYNHYVRHSTCTYQTELETMEQRAAWFEGRGDLYPVIVAEADNTVIGWASISKFKQRQAYRPTVELSIYLRQGKTGRGTGSLLMKEIVRLAKEAGYHSIIAGISGDQELSIHMHEKHGFKKVAHLEEVGHKFNNWLDVLYYQLML